VAYLIDTNVVSEITAKQPEEHVVRWLDGKGRRELWLSAVTVGELRYGVERLPLGAKRLRLQQYLIRLLRRFDGQVLPLNIPIAETWGRVRRQAELARRSMPLEDAMLAATAEVHELTLVTRNTRDFEGWGGPVLNPWEPQPSTP
jgi:predicted nucleic acid-binding protein